MEPTENVSIEGLENVSEGLSTLLTFVQNVVMNATESARVQEKVLELIAVANDLVARAKPPAAVEPEADPVPSGLVETVTASTFDLDADAMVAAETPPAELPAEPEPDPVPAVVAESATTEVPVETPPVESPAPDSPQELPAETPAELPPADSGSGEGSSGGSGSGPD